MTDSYGAYILNYNNKLIIDEEFKTFSVQTAGAIALAPGLNAIPVSPASNTPVMIALKYSTAGYCAWVAMNYSGGYTYHMYVLSSTYMTINYLILRAGAAYEPNEGFVIYDSAGNLIFSSGEGYASLVNILTVSAAIRTNSASSTVYPSNTNNYFILGTIPTVAVSNSGIIQVACLGYAVSGSYLVGASIPYFTLPGINVGITAALSNGKMLELSYS
jgi:hypothetical protein